MRRRDIFRNGLFGTLSERENRLVLLGMSFTAFVIGCMDAPKVVGFLGLLGLVLTLVITVNQYYRVKSGQDPEDRSR